MLEVQGFKGNKRTELNGQKKRKTETKENKTEK